MTFFDWFKMGKDKNEQVNVVKLKEESIDPGAMAAGNPSAAAEAMAKIVGQTNSPTKVLMVQDGDYSEKVTEYALKMAQRLDCEIVALDVTDTPLQFEDERKERETNRFLEMAQKNAETFSLRADAMGIATEHFMKVGNPEEVIAELSKEDAGIRYVLTKPNQESAEADKDRVQVPVFDLNCSRL
ncbi:MAG: universal stress protein [Desulfobulbaceae bacterium]|nr:universal stress protein [Desulfobulbaceae bacterium]